MSDEKKMTAEEAHLAITEASKRKPQVQAVREKLQKLAEDEDKGLQMIASAIRTLMQQR
ncbi:hypothetical protein [Azospirillum sp. SYSU D00513]|uniref:hypothetical protein n=1 Tax=Azospirillum sp. SYSU D00513 TaxID=2812561 RepID=UPI001A96D216|nr:hypothetical protein [Azospirillum sp. SYSU D00513]